MEIIRGEELASRLDEVVERAAQDERIIVSHAGHQIAIVSFDDLAILESLDRDQDQQDVAEYQRIRSQPSETPIPFVRRR